MAEELKEAGGHSADTSRHKLTVAGGAAGAVLGSRRSKVAAVIGGIVGGAIGFLTGKTLGSGGKPVAEAESTEPVVVTVGDDDETNDGTESERDETETAGQDTDE
jgi:phage tail tape-measure protein